MKLLFILLSILCFHFNFAQVKKPSSERLDGIKTSSKELTKNASTDNTSVGQSGVMTTSAPLVEIKSRTMSFPLQLNYTSGITVDQKSGSVGLGWSMPIGSIVRDYGAFEPDYTSTSSELLMQSEISNFNGHMNPQITGGTPTNLGNHFDQKLQYDAIKTDNNSAYPISDEYHIRVNGMLQNTFWNKGQINQNHDWLTKDYERLKISHTVKTYSISQEFSRINNLNLGLLGNDYANDKTSFDKSGSFSAAIGLLPYVKNGYVFNPTAAVGQTFYPYGEKGIVKYEDFEKFVVVDEKGTTYIFGRPLRGQKYVFNDDPYWSANPRNYLAFPGDDGELPNETANDYGHYWKIDYIAEWLLTDILSADYVDKNGNGRVDDEDAGDWIHFEYTDPIKREGTVRVDDLMQQDVPMFREWSSFSQTDQTSSLMREMAYLTSISTPLQQIDFTISKRFEVDHDYYSKPANKFADTYYYEDRQFRSNGGPTEFDITYPVETMKYDQITIASKLFDKNLYTNQNQNIGKIILRYAEKGSPQELAVSNYLIRDNNNVDRLIDKPSDDDDFNIQNYLTNQGRGKTTLLGVDFYSSDFNENTKTSYKFDYAYNPSYDEIHKREIVRKYFYPSLRQSNVGAHPATEEEKANKGIPYMEKVLNSDGINFTTVYHSCSPNTSPTCVNTNEFLIDFAYVERKKIVTNNDLSALQISDIIHSTTLPSNLTFGYDVIIHPLQPIKDVYGYLYAVNCDKCPAAWSLTKITYPSGGTIEYEYERGDFLLDDDNSNWSIKENEIPVIKQANEMAEQISVWQSLHNKLADFVMPGDMDFRKTLTSSFSVSLDQTYGIRLKSKKIDDKINPLVIKTYEYGEGHFTALPAEYLQNYLSAYPNFISRESLRHSWEIGKYVSAYDDTWQNDFNNRVIYSTGYSGIALDDYVSCHFYTYIDEINSDLSKIRTNYRTFGRSELDRYIEYDLYAGKLETIQSSPRLLLGAKTLNKINIYLSQIEYFENNNTNPYKYEKFYYTNSEKINRNISFDYNSIASGSNDNYIFFWDIQNHLYLPIYDYNDNLPGHGPKYYLNNYTIDFIFFTPPFALSGDGNPEPFWQNYSGTGRGKCLVGRDDYVYQHSYSHLQNFATNSNHYLKWQSHKRLLTKKETYYKGLITTTNYQYDPSEYYLVQESVEAPSIPSSKTITTYEYTPQTYTTTSKFVDKNMLNFVSKKRTYWNNVGPSSFLSAVNYTYDFSSFEVPKQIEMEEYVTPVINNLSGNFVLDETSTSSWKKIEQKLLDINHDGMPISERNNRLYHKSVFGYDRNIIKASFDSPLRKFDATYTGFEDFHDRYALEDWNVNDESYKDETWYSKDIEIEEFDAYSLLTGNICEYDLPDEGSYFSSRYKNTITVGDGLEVGDKVIIELTSSTYADITGLTNYSWTTERVVSKIIPVPQSYFSNPIIGTYVKDFFVCFTELVEFPKSTYFTESYDIGANLIWIQVGGDWIRGYYNESAFYTISSTKIIKKNPVYNFSTIARTGEHSYRLPSIRETEAVAKTTPIRPVKIIVDPEEEPCDPNNVTEHCSYKYEASVWLRKDKEIHEYAVPGSLPSTGVYKYNRGTAVSGANNDGVELIFEVWNTDRTSSHHHKFYPTDLSNEWKQYTITINLWGDPTPYPDFTWVDFYVKNNINEIGTGINARTNVYADDILVYPTDAKYSYSIYDKFGNVTQQIDNNDVIQKENVYDEKGRLIASKNFEGKLISEIDYFENNNWSTKNNYISERTWIEPSKWHEKRYFMDGFGKTKQVAISDRDKDLTIFGETTIFNDRGLAIKQYKPYFKYGENLLEKHNDEYATLSNTIYNSSNAYTEVSHEATPEAAVSTVNSPKHSAETNFTKSQSNNLYGNVLALPNTPISYPANTLLVYEQQNEAHVKTKTYVDAYNRVVMQEQELGFDHTQNPDGSITVSNANLQYARTWYEYDKAGRLIKVYDPEGKQTTYTYNSISQLVEKITPDRGKVEYRYDKYKQLRFERNAKDLEAASLVPGNQISDQYKFYQYDAWGRNVKSGVRSAWLFPVPAGIILDQNQFNDYTLIENQEFPAENEKLIFVHNRYDFDGTRTNFNSSQLKEEIVYSEQVLDPSTLLYTSNKTDKTSYNYRADQQLKKVTYEYTDLPGIHTIEMSYNQFGFPIGKKYLHPTNNFYNFEWVSILDNFGKISLNRARHNNQNQDISKNYYDPFGNLIMKGLGKKNVNSDPHIDYLYQRMNIRDQLVNMMSKNLRIGLTYDMVGNIQNQYWSNEQFDPTTGTSVYNVNQYEYFYDLSNRMIGADYKRSINLTENPFAYFNNFKSNIPSPFNCTSILDTPDGPIKNELKALQQNIETNVEIDLSKKAINSLMILEREARKMEQSFESMNEQAQEAFLRKYMQETKREKENVLAYEWLKSKALNDTEHMTRLNARGSNPPELLDLKYTDRKLKEIILTIKKNCVTGTNGTVYSVLPNFTIPATANVEPYDVATWYTNSGNILTLNRNDQGGIQTRQIYSYLFPNNQLTTVNFIVGGASPVPVEYKYDRLGNITKDPRNNGITNFNYTSFSDLPQTIQTSQGSFRYRYDTRQQRTVKDLSTSNKEFYIGEVILDQTGAVKSYQTSDGYAIPNTTSGNISYFYYVKDWLGTTRVIIDNNGAVINATDHYPYGKRMPNRELVVDQEGNRYQFTGHEKDGENSYEYHGARYYNEEIGRYMNVDPMAETTPGWSPYHYALCNPAMFTDPTGKVAESVNGDDKKKNKKEEKREKKEDKPKREQPKYIPAPKELEGFPGAVKLPRGDGQRVGWKLPSGNIGEWDSQHGEVEVYDKTGKKHKGAWNPETGKQIKEPVPGRTASRSKMEIDTDAIQQATNVVWTVVKWTGAILAAPETGGLSLVLATATSL